MQEDPTKMPTSDSPDRKVTLQVTLDFDAMYEAVLEKHWGWWGERPESFEEYCCMIAAYELAERVERNEFEDREIADAVKRWLRDEGERIAREHGERILDADGKFKFHTTRFGEKSGQVTPEEFFEREVELRLIALADEYARKVHAEMVVKQEADQ